MLQERFDDAGIGATGVRAARRRLAEATRTVEIQREMLEALPAFSAAHAAALEWMKLSERAAFNRRLELEALLRRRTQRPSEIPRSRWFTVPRP